MSGIFGKSSSEEALERFEPTSFITPGHTGRFSGDQFFLSRTSQGRSALDDLVAGFDARAAEFRGQRERVRPGFGELTRTRVEAIRQAGLRTVGNLREELSKRRVAGSSFGQGQIASEEARFGRLEEQTRAESFLQELALTTQLIQKEFDSTIAGLATVLSQLNIETALAADLSKAGGEQRLSALGATGSASAARSEGNAELFATIATIAIAVFSDRRLKKNIRRKGTVNGYPWYSFEYIWGELSEGVMSDEIPAGYVYIHSSGYDLVNYSQLLKE